MRCDIIYIGDMLEQSFGALSPKIKAEFYRGPDPSQRLDFFLQGRAPKGLIEFGAVYINRKRIIDPAFEVSSGDVIRVHLNPKRYFLDKGEILSRVIFENDHYIVVDKPSGLPMHPTLDNLYENLLCAFSFPAYVTHRLDVPTSGLVAVAKSKEYQRLFNQLIMERKVQKIYEATVLKELPLGEVVHYMENTVKAPKRFALQPGQGQERGWLECRMDILGCEKGSQGRFKVTIELKTGRTHQIRGQLALLGAPILGDQMYGGCANPQFCLRSCSLLFTCPMEKKEKRYQLTFG